MLKRLSALVMALALVLPLLYGCLGAMSLDEYGYVISIGVDQGEAKRYSVSFLIQNVSSSQADSSAAGALLVSAEGDNLIDAIGIIHAGVPYLLNLSRTNYIAFSDAVASSELMREFFSVSLHSLRIRETVKLAILTGSCKGYFEGLNAPTQPSIAKRHLSLFQNHEVEGIIPMTSLAIFHEAVEDGRFDAILPAGYVDESVQPNEGMVDNTGEGSNQQGGQGASGGAAQQKEGEQENDTTAGTIRTGGMSSYMMGSALFDGWELAGILNGDDTKLLLMALGDFDKGHITVPDGENAITLGLTCDRAPDVDLALAPQPRATMRIDLACELEVDTSGTADDRWQEGLREAAEGYIEAELQRVFSRCKELNSDAMGFGRYASMLYCDASEWEALNWKGNQYQRLTVDFQVTLRLNGQKSATHME